MSKIVNEYVDLAGDAVSTLVGLGTSLLAGRVEQYAQVGDEIVKTLRNNGETQTADTAATLQRRALELARYLRERDGRRIWSDAQDAMNGRGWIAAGAGLMTGFVISRAMRTSPR